MNDNTVLELTAEEAARVHGGYDALRLAAIPFLWQGTFGLWTEPASATPIQLPSFS